MRYGIFINARLVWECFKSLDINACNARYAKEYSDGSVELSVGPKIITLKGVTEKIRKWLILELIEDQ